MDMMLVTDASSAGTFKRYSSYSRIRKSARQENDRLHFQKHVCVFSLCWVEDNQQGNSNLLVGCTSLGEIIVWSPSSTTTNPILRRKVTNKGKLYSIKFYQNKRILVVSGDCGVQVFDWDKDIRSLLQQQQQQQSINPSDTLEAIATFHPHPSPTELRVEVNDFDLLQAGSGDYLMGAAGDLFGVYKWDLSTGRLLSNYSSPERKGIYALNLLPPDSSNCQHTLLVGGEGGRVHLWDASKDSMIGSIDCKSSPDPSKSTTSTRVMAGKRAKVMPSRWVSSICAQDPTWFTVAGGILSGNGKSSGNNNNNGFLATYHAPSRSVVSYKETRETPHKVVSDLVQSDTQSIVCVANDGIVSHYNALSLEREGRKWCTSPSSYAVAVSSDGRTAVAGVSSFVDVFDKSGEKLLLEIA